MAAMEALQWEQWLRNISERWCWGHLHWVQLDSVALLFSWRSPTWAAETFTQRNNSLSIRRKTTKQANFALARRIPVIFPGTARAIYLQSLDHVSNLLGDTYSSSRGKNELKKPARTISTAHRRREAPQSRSQRPLSRITRPCCHRAPHSTETSHFCVILTTASKRIK